MLKMLVVKLAILNTFNFVLKLNSFFVYIPRTIEYLLIVGILLKNAIRDHLANLKLQMAAIEKTNNSTNNLTT